MSENPDRLYANQLTHIEDFVFDQRVVDVFPDMIKRSVPGYTTIIAMIGDLAERYARSDSRCYDLGCSLGAATLAMRQGIRAPGCRIVAVDNAPAMIERCERLLDADNATHPARPPVDLELGDLRDVDIRDASLVVMNYTLQFVPPEDRDAVIRNVACGLRPGGLLFLSEKVVDEDPRMESLLVDLYHEHKRRNDYSALEIARKRAALENVLVPETVAVHRRRLLGSGFGSVAVWLRHFNFVSLIAIKPGADP